MERSLVNYQKRKFEKKKLKNENNITFIQNHSQKKILHLFRIRRWPGPTWSACTIKEHRRFAYNIILFASQNPSRCHLKSEWLPPHVTTWLLHHYLSSPGYTRNYAPTWGPFLSIRTLCWAYKRHRFGLFPAYTKRIVSR